MRYHIRYCYIYHIRYRIFISYAISYRLSQKKAITHAISHAISHEISFPVPIVGRCDKNKKMCDIACDIAWDIASGPIVDNSKYAISYTISHTISHNDAISHEISYKISHKISLWCDIEWISSAISCTIFSPVPALCACSGCRCGHAPAPGAPPAPPASLSASRNCRLMILMPRCEDWQPWALGMGIMRGCSPVAGENGMWRPSLLVSSADSDKGCNSMALTLGLGHSPGVGSSSSSDWVLGWVVQVTASVY